MAECELTRPPDDGVGAEPTDAAEREVFLKLRPLVSNVTGVSTDEIRMDSVLMTDLGAESLDLLDLSFLIEEEFGITLESDEFGSQAAERLDGAAYESDGYLTEAALSELHRVLPEVDPRALAPGLRKMVLPSVLPVAVFVHLIQRKLAAQTQGDGHARGNA
ncbi:MAG: phosphopantetheine-binding protein [Phycisphaerae bacterium]